MKFIAPVDCTVVAFRLVGQFYFKIQSFIKAGLSRILAQLGNGLALLYLSLQILATESAARAPDFIDF